MRHRGMVAVSFLLLDAGLIVGVIPPEDEEVHAEHVEGGHAGDHHHPHTPEGAVGKACGKNLVLGEESGKRGYTGDGKTAYEECDVGYGHVFSEAAHGCVVVGVHSVDERAGSEEQEGLEHGVSEEVEHGGHVTETFVDGLAVL